MFVNIGVTEAPATQTVNYYSSVSFTCRGIGDELHWTINTLPVDCYPLCGELLFPAERITINNTIDGHDLSSTLTFEVLPTNDSSIIIGCVIVTLSPFDIRGPTAQLIIRGISYIRL